MTRAGFILAATLLLAPACALAQQKKNILGDAPGSDTIFASTIVRQDEAPTSLLTGMSHSTMSVEGPLATANTDLDDTLTDLRTDFSFVSISDDESTAASDDPSTASGPDCEQDCLEYVCGNLCGPDICRFDRCADCSENCVTDQYCQHCCTESTGHCRQVDESGVWVCNGCGCDVQGRPSSGPGIVGRFGWWGTSNNGSAVKTGEWQGLNSSPFWDLDGISSNGNQTIDFFATGNDNETSKGRLYWYNQKFTADIDFNRFIHRLDHKPLYGFQRPDGSDAVATNDLNLGEDYAIRVQQLDANIKGRLTKNLRWKLNLWGMRKSGERQVSSTQHCFDAGGGGTNQCHVQSQRQQIDWLTMRMEPVIEANFFQGKLNVEYSRPMQYFATRDQRTQRLYNHFGFFQNPDPVSGEGGAGFYDYAFVPENFMQIDRLKVQAVVTENDTIYANLLSGNLENKLRKTNRRFYGYDLRWTNHYFERLTVNTYAKYFKERQQAPPFFLGINQQVEPINNLMSLSGNRFNDIHTPLNFTRTKAGIDIRWRPVFGNWEPRRLRIKAGYEYMQLDRDNGSYVIADDSRTEPPLNPASVYTLPNSTTHKLYIGATKQLNQVANGYVRYKVRLTDDPLYGLRLSDENYGNGDVSTFSNTSLPQRQHVVEVGGSWVPSAFFGANLYAAIENRSTDNAFARFNEDNYPIVTSAWCRPHDQWTFTGGYAFYSNWIDQDITIGFRESGDTNAAFTDPWRYTGTSQVASLGAMYEATSSLKLTGGLQYVRGRDAIKNSFSVGDWSQLPNFTNVNVQTWRCNAGLDYLIGESIAGFVRYNYFDYNDMSLATNSGASHFLLGGLTIVQ